jgi:hypothetical protein
VHDVTKKLDRVRKHEQGKAQVALDAKIYRTEQPLKLLRQAIKMAVSASAYSFTTARYFWLLLSFVLALAVAI